MFFLHENLSLHGYIRLISTVIACCSLANCSFACIAGWIWICPFHSMYPITYIQLDAVFQWSTVSVEGGGCEKTFCAPDSA